MSQQSETNGYKSFAMTETVDTGFESERLTFSDTTL